MNDDVKTGPNDADRERLLRIAGLEHDLSVARGIGAEYERLAIHRTGEVDGLRAEVKELEASGRARAAKLEMTEAAYRQLRSDMDNVVAENRAEHARAEDYKATIAGLLRLRSEEVAP